jgi:hypothetical protein
MQTATRDIKAYKVFVGTNSHNSSPYQSFRWGRLFVGKILRSGAFDEQDTICADGVHASRLRYDAGIIRNFTEEECVIWAVVIPKGTRYYKSTVKESQLKMDGNSKGEQYRAEKVKLVRQVK